MLATLTDRYTIENELGRGGMATVYLALDRKHRRKVAIKVLAPELAATLGSERFLREIRIAAGLVHPHILPLIDSGESDGLLYYVTPLLGGGSLRDRLSDERRLPLDDAVRIVKQIGSALDYAHREGFIHRDVKPDNILFADGLAVLADFGIARAGGGGGAGLTEVGLALGTPEYMSPEQASGDGELTGASDLYALACVLYEMLVGNPPFQASTPGATRLRQLTGTPLPVRALRPELPVYVELAIARGLSRDPRDRFASAAELVAALESESSSGNLPRRPAIGRGIVVLPFVNASPDPDTEYLSDGITDELINALAKVEGLRVASRTSAFALKGKPQDVRAIGALLGAAWVLEGTVRRAGDRLRVTAQLSSTEDGRLLWSERYDRTFADVFAIEDEIAHTIVNTLRTTSFAELVEPTPKRYTENLKAYGLYLKGRFAWNKRTQEGVTEAIALFEQAIEADRRYAPAYTGLSDSYALQLDYRNVPVAEGFARAKAYARQALELDDSLAEAHASLAWSLFIYDWDFPAARQEFQRAIELDPGYATAHQWYAFCLAAHGRLDEALVETHTALELDPGSVSIRRAVGWIYYYARRYDQARYHLTRAIAMNPTAEETYRVFGLTLAMQGQWAEAERVIREGMELADTNSYTMASLVYVLGRAGDRPRAEALLHELERRAQEDYVSPVAFATALIGLGDLSGALDWAERAWEERRGWLVYFGVNPLVDPLRGEPRFHALLGRLRM